MNDRGRIEPWNARYDNYGKLIERTDFNAGNIKAGIPSIHHHTIKYLPLGQYQYGNHIPEVGPNTNWIKFYYKP